MVKLHYQDRLYQLKDGETVLDGLLRQDVKIQNSCRAGHCQSCMMRADQGQIPVNAQQGLKDTLKAKGYFLSCVCVPDNDLMLKDPDNSLQIPVNISDLRRISDDVLRVRLACSDQFSYMSGQFINLLRADGLCRSYSLASLPADDHLELHVRIIPNGRMSGWLNSDAVIGERMYIQGPAGDCFYVPGKPDQPLLLIGTGTGLAPLYGVIKDALAQNHKGEIALFHGALTNSGLYLTEELKDLANQFAQFKYYPSVLKGTADNLVNVGNIEQLVNNYLTNFKGWRVFLCGHPELVTSLRKKIFLKGASMKEIHTDPFLPSVN